MPGYSTTIVDWHSHETTIRSIRRSVFMLEQGVCEALEIDPHDCRYTHALARDDDANGIATGRLQVNRADGQIGRMAVLRAWRGRGVGSAILNRLLAAAEARDLKRNRAACPVPREIILCRTGFC